MKTINLTLIFVLFSIEAYTQSNLVIKTRDGNWIDVPVDNFLHLDFAPCGIIDYGGQTYYTIKIGDQCWFAQNLNIGTQVTGGVNQSQNGIIEKYCYNNEPDSCTIYGGLYQWNEVVQYADPPEGTQGICPSGWHIPSLSEYSTLMATLSYDQRSIKEIGEGNGTNTSGFSLLLAGDWSINGYFWDYNNWAYLWTSSIYSGDPTKSYNVPFYSSGTSGFGYGYLSQAYGFSVRCIKD